MSRDGVSVDASKRATPASLPRGPLGLLVDDIAAQSLSRGAMRDGPEALAWFRKTWSQLRTRKQLAQALASLPENPGPLNSHHLAHRALQLMHEVSPDYLNRFMSHVEMLSMLEQMDEGQGVGNAGKTKKSSGGRKSKRTGAA